MSKPSDVEVRATTFVKDNRDLLEADSPGPLTLQTIARAGSLIAVELCDEIVVAADAYEKALYEGRDALLGSDSEKDLNPRRVAAAESRIPTLKATYDRKSRAFEELNQLTESAIKRYEAGKEYTWALGAPSSVDNGDGTYTHTWPPEPRIKFEPASRDIFQKMAEMSGPVTPTRVRKAPWWKRMFGRSNG